MSTKAIGPALFFGAGCAAVVALHVLRSDKPPVQFPTMNAPAARAPTPHRDELPRTGPGRWRSDQPERSPAAKAPFTPQAALPAMMEQARQSAGLEQLPNSAALDTERAFEAESADPRWAPGMESTIYLQLAQITDAQIDTMEVECRTSMCRIQLIQHVTSQHDGERFADPVFAVYDKLFESLGYPALPVMLAVDGSGTATSLVYLPRRDPAGTDSRANDVQAANP